MEELRDLMRVRQDDCEELDLLLDLLLLKRIDLPGMDKKGSSAAVLVKLVL